MNAPDYNMNELFPSNYLKGDEFEEGQTIEFTIHGMETKEFNGPRGKEVKLTLTPTARGLKPLILNKTNFKEIVKQHGDKTSQWLGKTVYLVARTERSFDEYKRMLFVLPPDLVAPNQVAATATPVSQPDAKIPVIQQLVDRQHAKGNKISIDQAREMLKAMGYSFPAPRSVDLEECHTLISDFLESGAPTPGIPDKPKPGQESNATHTSPVAKIAGAADDGDDSDPFADET